MVRRAQDRDDSAGKAEQEMNYLLNSAERTRAEFLKLVFRCRRSNQRVLFVIYVLIF